MITFTPLHLPSIKTPNESVIEKNFSLIGTSLSSINGDLSTLSNKVSGLTVVSKSLSSLSASLPVFTDSTGNLVSNPMTGTVNVVMSNSPTFTGTILAGAATLSGAISASNLSGTNTGDQTITLTGDVTGSGTGSFVTTIGANKVLNSMVLSLAWSKLTGTPTTLSGYGITDAVLSSRTISTASPLTGGGDLSANRTLSITSATLSGTTNQVSLSASGANVLLGSGNITLSLPQNIHTAASPTFASMTLSGRLNIGGATDTAGYSVNVFGGAIAVDQANPLYSFGVGNPASADNEFVYLRKLGVGNPAVLEVTKTGTGAHHSLQIKAGGSTQLTVDQAGGIIVANQAGTGTRITTSTSTGAQGNSAAIDGNYTLSGTLTSAEVGGSAYNYRITQTAGSGANLDSIFAATVGGGGTMSLAIGNISNNAVNLLSNNIQRYSLSGSGTHTFTSLSTKVRFDCPASFLSVGGVPVVTTGDLTLSDQHYQVTMTSTSGTQTLTLPPAATYPGISYFIGVSYTGGTQNIVRSGSATGDRIYAPDGLDYVTWTANAGNSRGFILFSDGVSHWRVIGGV